VPTDSVEWKSGTVRSVPTFKVHFGYTDGISITTIHGGPERYPPDHQQPCEPCCLCCGTNAENYLMPEPRKLGLNGSFAVFKMIKTDVVEFEEFLQSNKDKIDPELLAAKMCGRCATAFRWHCPQKAIALRADFLLSISITSNT